MADRPKYLIQADPPGMEIAGYGVVPHGTELSTPHDFPPRASMFPLNESAVAAFDRQKEKVAKEYRAKYTAEGMSAKEIEAEIKVVLAKVGPNPRRTQAGIEKERPRFAPGTFSESAPRAKTPEDDAPDMMPQPKSSGRASDSA